VFIYLITNTINGKYYVGKTELPPLKRWHDHCSCARRSSKRAPLLYRAMNKHGLTSFSFEVIAETNSSDQLNKLEQLWIWALDSTNPECGYNLTFGGTGGPPTEATREKLRGPKSEEHKRNLSEAKRGSSVAHMASAEARTKAWATRRRNTSLINGMSTTTRMRMSQAASRRAVEHPEHLVTARASRRPQVRGPLGTFIPRDSEGR
jgi:group I intron endonuclease